MRAQIKSLRAVHSKNIIHADIHPGNVCFTSYRQGEHGLEKVDGVVSLVDFGDSYIQGEDYKDQGVNCTYSSRNMQNGEGVVTMFKPDLCLWHLIFLIFLLVPSFGDDLESLARTLVYAFTGDTPFLSEEYSPLDDQRIPQGVGEFLLYTQSLASQETPDYERCVHMLEAC